MNDQQIKQRIAYLVEHGGLADDPLDEIRQRVRVLYIMLTAALGFHVVEAVLYLI